MPGVVKNSKDEVHKLGKKMSGYSKLVGLYLTDKLNPVVMK